MAPTCYLWLSRFCCVLGLGFLGAAAYCYFAPSPGPALHVAHAEITFSDAEPKEKRDVVFHLDNRSGKPMRVLGLSGC